MSEATMATSAAPITAVIHNQDRNEWRKVLGQYPTGVTIITSLDESSHPVGMVVGTFTSVSQDPPLVGFLPMVSSRTLPQIQQAGRFRASVLGDEHEDFARWFVRASYDERFSGDHWEYDEHGIPRLRDAVAWFDASIFGVTDAGDHKFVLGAVEKLGIGKDSASMPLLFLGGSYGSFIAPHSKFSAPDLGKRLRLAEHVRESLQALADDLRVECALETVVGDSVVIVSTANIQAPYVGVSFPFVAPYAPALAVWGAAKRREAWVRSARHITGDAQSGSLDETLERVWHNGFALSCGESMSSHFDRVVNAAPHDSVPATHLLNSVDETHELYARSEPGHGLTSVVQVPIFDEDGVATFALLVNSDGPGVSPSRCREIITRAIEAGLGITELIGGTIPAEYAPVAP